MLLEGATWLIALRAFRQQSKNVDVLEAVQLSKDPTIFTVLIEDSAALAGLCIAAAGLAGAQALGLPWLDGVGSVLIGLLLASTATFLARECKGLLMGEAADPATRAGLRRIAASNSGVVAVNEVLTMHFGPMDVLAVLSLDFENALTADDVEIAVSGIEQQIKREYPIDENRILVRGFSMAVHPPGTSAHTTPVCGPRSRPARALPRLLNTST